jgi:very-short-patch-repair endonuclease
MPPRRRDLDARAAIIAKKYTLGLSTHALAREYNCSPGRINLCLRMKGKSARSWSEAGVNRILLETDDTKVARRERLALLGEARRGKPRSRKVSLSRAATYERTQSQVGEYEQALAKALRCLNVKTTAQLAVDRYNLDLASPPFAIEVHNSRHRPTSRSYIVQRIEDLRDLGWHVIYIWHTPIVNPCSWGRQFNAAAVAKQVVAFMNLTGFNPTTARQYQVLRGDGHSAARFRTKRDKISVV